ncbi:HupE/UreJ family protein [Halovulum sp. GXIMD14794]
MRRALAIFFAVLPGPALAHDAFGDLGPFYASLLHPLADPAQGLILVAVAVLLARQPVETVRPAYAALAVAGLLAAAAHLVLASAGPGPQAMGIGAALVAGLALSGVRVPIAVAVALSGIAALAAGFALDLPEGRRAALLAVLGGGLGIALLPLLAWGLVEFLQDRLGRVAGAVAASWVAAVGIMSAALQG